MLRILLIDDNPDDRILATRELHAEFSEVEVTSIIDAKGLDEALEICNFDLIITDYQLRWTDGLTVVNAVKAKYPDMPVIMFTDSGSEEVAVKGMKSGLSDYVLKGRPIRRLAIAVRESLEKQRIRQEYAAALEQLQLSEERFRLALDSAKLGSWDWNMLTNEIVWSENHELLFGLAPGSFLGTYEAFIACVHPDDRELIAESITRALETKTDYNQEHRVIWADGSIHWIAGRGKFFYDKSGKPTRMSGVVLDISERKQRELELEQENRMKDEFLAIVSHELRTPLNAILGWTQLLRTRDFDEETKNRSLEIIARNANQQNQLINDILDTSRLMRGKMQLEKSPVDLANVIENTLNTVELTAQAKSLKLISILNGSVGQVMGDQNRLQQIVWNLLYNAIKFTPPEGTIEIRLSQVEDKGINRQGDKQTRGQTDKGTILSPPTGEPVASNASTPARRWTHHPPLSPLPPTPLGGDACAPPLPLPLSPSLYACITVSDTGEGITSDFLPYIFERFRQADSKFSHSRNGLGLGLAIVRQLVELHGGTVTAESKGKGQGATFTVLLPLATVEPQFNNAPTNFDEVSSNATQLLSGLQVLAVDDDDDTLELLSMILEEEGAQVTAVSSVNQALQVLETLKPDILISDIGMPDADGYDLIRQIRLNETLNGEMLPAIALTAYGRSEDEKWALTAGFQLYLAKPVEPMILVEAIANLTANGVKMGNG
ncbi:multi-sensor hybrid histidine kinase [Tolypothrix sp. NIES-4075]|uniref:hybrid sensor histidine kinase/response regulator n=1 Tax=Tolypothrix sp. NIES-4075 TaxID=2005459 RepID=UPI000B5CA038|nr:response regulator [Tolypothrix sp. NIES-4075]GAX40304.1 multi-sensor hybrid histidine kinase [Tolypothrix sp. NIES-4075]